MIYKELVKNLKEIILGTEETKGYFFKLQEHNWDKEQYEEVKALIASGNNALQKETQYDKSILDLIEWSSNFYGETLMFLQKQNRTNEFLDVWSDWVKAFGNEYEQD